MHPILSVAHEPFSNNQLELNTNIEPLGLKTVGNAWRLEKQYFGSLSGLNASFDAKPYFKMLLFASVTPMTKSNLFILCFVIASVIDESNLNGDVGCSNIRDLSANL